MAGELNPCVHETVAAERHLWDEGFVVGGLQGRERSLTSGNTGAGAGLPNQRKPG